MTKKHLKKLLELFFAAKLDDERYCHSTNSVLANIVIENETSFYEKVWMKRHRETKQVNKTARHIGGYSRIENNSVYQEINSIFKQLEPSWQTMLYKNIVFDRSYQELSEDLKELHLTSDQIKEIFRRKIYPKFLNNLPF